MLSATAQQLARAGCQVQSVATRPQTGPCDRCAASTAGVCSLRVFLSAVGAVGDAGGSGWLSGASVAQASPGWLPSITGRILLVDASRLKVPAGSGEDVRMHCASDLQAGRLVQVEVTDRHNAEGLHHFALRQGDVAVTDAGYQLGTSVQQGQAQGAYGVHRFSSHQVRLER